MLHVCVYINSLQSRANSFGSELLACSRFAWALARDKALPFSHLIRRVSKQRIPYVAVQLIVVLTLMGLLFVAVEEEIIQTLVLASGAS